MHRVSEGVHRSIYVCICTRIKKICIGGFSVELLHPPYFVQNSRASISHEMKVPLPMFHTPTVQITLGWQFSLNQLEGDERLRYTSGSFHISSHTMMHFHTFLDRSSPPFFVFLLKWKDSSHLSKVIDSVGTPHGWIF